MILNFQLDPNMVGFKLNMETVEIVHIRNCDTNMQTIVLHIGQIESREKLEADIPLVVKGMCNMAQSHS